MNENAIVIDVNLNTKSFDAQIKETEDKLNDMLADYDMLANSKGFDEQSNQAKHLRSEIEKTANQLQNLKKKQNELEKSTFSKQLQNIPKIMEDVSNRTTNILNKITRWGLALFGIRSAYMFIRQAMSTLSQYNEQLATDVEYIRFALATTLQPVIESLIQLVYKLLAYTSMLAKAWFGVDLFANATIEAFNKSEKSLGGAVKNAKELKKQLAGFDEMNILQDTSSSGGGGGTSGIKTPSFDLSAMQDVKVPSWLQWIFDNGDKIAEILLGIGMALVALKAGLDPLTSLGIGLIVVGVYEALKNLLDFIKNPTFENFVEVLKGIAIAVLGVGLAFSAWPVAVTGAVALIVIEIVKHFDFIKETLDNFLVWMDANFLGGLKNLFGPLGELMYVPFRYFVGLAIHIFETFYGGIKKVIDGIVKLFQGDFTGGLSSIASGWLDILLAPILGFAKSVRDIIPHILNAFQEIGTKVGDVLGGAFKRVMNSAIYSVENMMSSPINSINRLIDTINQVPNINIKRLPQISLPRLAKGTILNNPGVGVPVASGSAIAGEAGREAYLPLTDTQLLEELGSTIGKYITINANITNSMNGRIISRELQKINAENNFAFNK